VARATTQVRGLVGYVAFATNVSRETNVGLAANVAASYGVGASGADSAAGFGGWLRGLASGADSAAKVLLEKVP
jgi:hypothetical protein